MNAVGKLAFVAAMALLHGVGVGSADPQIDIESLNRRADQIHGNGKTALMMAAKERNLELVTKLMASGANARRVNDNGGSPLMYAALGGDARIVELFIQHNADINARAKNGWSAIMIGAAKGYLEVVTTLLRHGADPNLEDVYLWTPLMRASYENRVEIAKLLLSDPRTDVNRRGENGLTALHLAVVRGHLEVADCLLRAGADPGIVDQSGRTPAAIAEASADRRLIHRLR